MPTFKQYITGIAIAVLAITCARFANATDTHIGRALTAEEQKHLQALVFADGTGLPAGEGTVQAGREIYNAQCAACHGGSGEGANSIELVGDRSLLSTEYPDKGVGVYWPFAPTLFAYIKRAMPPQAPGSMTNKDLYSVTAYVLFLNDLLPETATANSETLKQINMPNRDGFKNIYQQKQ